MLQEFITKDTFSEDAVCESWQEVLELAGGLLIRQGAIEESYLDSVRDAVDEFGGYMVLIDDIAFFHGRPGEGVHRLAMSLVTLRNPVYLEGKRIRAAFVFAAVDRSSHIELLQEFGEALQDEDFLKLLRENADKEEILKRIAEGVKKH